MLDKRRKNRKPVSNYLSSMDTAACTNHIFVRLLSVSCECSFVSNKHSIMRYNIYNQVHRPLKLSMLKTSVEITAMPTINNENTSELISKIEEVMQLFKELVQFEHTYVLPLVFDFEPSIWNLYTTEHQAAMNLCRKVEDRISFYKNRTDENRKVAAMKSVTEAFEQFMTFNLQHMNEEEEVLNEILWRYYSDNVLMEIEHGMQVLSMSAQQSIAA
jgi:hypothetical protein